MANGDDDIDDLVDEIRRTNQNINELSNNVQNLVDAIIRGSRQEEEEDEGVTQPRDLWDQGSMPVGTASTVDEYIRLRRRTSSSDELTVPKVESDDYADFYHKVFLAGGEHLQLIYQQLSNSEWKEFVQKVAISFGAEEELVDLLNTDPIYFGIRVQNKVVNAYASSTHMSFRRTYGNIWILPTAEIPTGQFRGPPWQVLDLIQPADEDTELINGVLTPREINVKMAEEISSRGNISLPDRFIPLLS